MEGVQATPIEDDGQDEAATDLTPTPGMERFDLPGEENMFILSEAPRFRLINWRRTTRFHLAFPWVHYKAEYYPSLKRYWLWEVYFSKYSLKKYSGVCYPFFPNFYQARPCDHVGMGITSRPEDVAINLWEGSFNWDGELANRSIWKQIAHRANVKSTKRRDVLEYWDKNLTIEDILSMHYPTEAVLKVKTDE